MIHNTYAQNNTALLLVDPYNDFLAEGGKAWPFIGWTTFTGPPAGN
ncbi:hypothetical protein NVV93_02740 [Pseudomonas sp. LS44]|nr:hypothetical protein [Pseudomonas sp. LS44]UVE18338.1 hypothetical protein NVV93_02740 [Pseudomonas sp. LS44]